MGSTWDFHITQRWKCLGPKLQNASIAAIELIQTSFHIYQDTEDGKLFGMSTELMNKVRFPNQEVISVPQNLIHTGLLSLI